eukprot:XP_015154919.2 phosphoethanolamine/phosphocholine phosphatase isoform X1 [Gallus gallus]
MREPAPLRLSPVPAGPEERPRIIRHRPRSVCPAVRSWRLPVPLLCVRPSAAPSPGANRAPGADFGLLGAPAGCHPPPHSSSLQALNNVRKHGRFHFILEGLLFFCRRWKDTLPGSSCPGVGMASSRPPKYLLVFDFDETIINENSDDSIVRAAPGQALPEHIRQSFREGFYNEYMQRVLAYMGDQGVKMGDFKAVYENIPLSPGMPDLFQFLSKNHELFEIILISDANMFGIECKLRAAGFYSLFRKIFSNPSSFDKRGYFTLGPYHSHKCLDCPANMCKRKILTEYLAERAQEEVEFERVFYVGDGANDFCPSVTLTSADVAFPRKGYPMHQMTQEMEKKQPGTFQATVVPWESATEVARYLQELLKKKC